MRRGIFFLLAILLAPAVPAAPAGVRDALEGSRFGLYEASRFRLTPGRCADCPTVPQALWYFQDDLVAVPKAAPAGYDRGLRVQDDVRAWMKAHPDGDGSNPPLVWVGSPLLAEGLRLSADGRELRGADGAKTPFAVAPKIRTNLSYYDDSSVRHFAGRTLRMRGRMEKDAFVARALWPEDYALDFAKLPARPLGKDETLPALVRADQGGARLPFSARLLWQRDPAAARDWAGKPVLGVMLNGAQGDDDEAHGGHFAIVTGAFGPRGEWGEWLVNNFYNLDSFSEKGIVAATVPMDGYMADLNSGQSWYRPSYMLVAVLKQARAPALYQEGVGRVYNHFYRHDFHYRHTDANCAGISMQTLRSLGWQHPEQGPTSRLKAVAALPYVALTEASLERGRGAHDYLSTKQTDLFPFVAFEAAGHDLLDLGAQRRPAASPFERMLAEDLEALIFLRIPQFPSSRAFGEAPIASLDEYLKRIPEDESKRKIVPVDPRPFPPELQDPAAPSEPPPPSLYVLWAYGLILLLGATSAWMWLPARRRRRKKRA